MSQSSRLTANIEPSLNSAVYLQQIVDDNKDYSADDEVASTVYSDSVNMTDTLKDAHRRFEFKLYSLWNAIRFAIIAAVIGGANFINQKQIESYRGYCCNCYYVALEPEKYGIDKDNYRIDWSYCMPECVDCNYCKQHYHNNANESFMVTNQTCRAKDYSDKTKTKFNLNWAKHCPDNISITSLTFFPKDYRVYGVSTVILVMLYIFLMTAFVFCCKSYARPGINFGASLLVYNVIVSINAVYSMFKPMQYYHKRITQNVITDIICEVDTINEVMEHFLTYCVEASFLFISLQWIMGVIGCLITRKANSSKKKTGSVAMLPYKIRMAYIRFEKVMIVLAVVLGVIFHLTLIYASAVMILKRVESVKEHHALWKIGVIVVVNVLAISSCFDIFCFPFCRHTCSNYFGSSRNKTEFEQKTFYMLTRSFDDSNTEYRMSLLRADETDIQL